ncbi:MAG: hypothetical protein ACHBN1_33450 [Heteroscytonema crispum UTEX LB 1556]
MVNCWWLIVGGCLERATNNHQPPTNNQPPTTTNHQPTTKPQN